MKNGLHSLGGRSTGNARRDLVPLLWRKQVKQLPELLKGEPGTDQKTRIGVVLVSIRHLGKHAYILE